MFGVFVFDLVPFSIAQLDIWYDGRMELTQPVEWINKPVIGYAVNTEFSDDNARVLMELINKISATFTDAVFCPPRSALHITLLDWITPLVNYDGRDKNVLFAAVQPSYDKALSDILASTRPITVTFDGIKVSPSTIYITGHDTGEFQKIRDQFVSSVELLPNTKLPPAIIHSSLARFTKPIELSSANAFAANQQLDITQKVTNFRLIRTTREPNLNFETLKRYELS